MLSATTSEFYGTGKKPDNKTTEWGKSLRGVWAEVQNVGLQGILPHLHEEEEKNIYSPSSPS